jgi:hypothetical protein
MKISVKPLLIVASILIFGNASADQIINGCAKAILGGQICPKEPRGTLILDGLNNAKCAPGQCVIDVLGNAICATTPGGRVVLDVLNQPTCQGGCMRPTPQLCEKLG